MENAWRLPFIQSTIAHRLQYKNPFYLLVCLFFHAITIAAVAAVVGDANICIDSLLQNIRHTSAKTLKIKIH